MKNAILVVLMVVGIAAGSFWCGMRWQEGREKAAASDRALWIARVWRDGMTMDQACRQAAESGGIAVPVDEWDPGLEGDVALGPMISGQRICVRRDRSIYWRATR